MKVIYEHDIGGDGAKGGLYVEGSQLQLKVAYPIEKLLAPALEKLDPLGVKIKELIPGNYEDSIIDDMVLKIKAEIVKLLSE